MELSLNLQRNGLGAQGMLGRGPACIRDGSDAQSSTVLATLTGHLPPRHAVWKDALSVSFPVFSE
ncbi:hypothetical protein E2C01_020639 [Portunus trituberculatus]|uniref:Uncharacterized protein n=1 Tax=Portunus trituberculatus TaxID=210409 RepID=A0A5B7E240_PORTR|nr:hypothetical protein [Portunus trituberculatus]